MSVKPTFPALADLTMTPEQAAILSLLARVEALEKAVGNVAGVAVFKSRRGA